MTSNQYKPVHSIVAPAGYGKSVLVSQWLDHIGENYSWVSLGEDCNDLKKFLRLLCTAILPYLSVKNDICDILIESPELPDLEHVATRIVNSFAEIEDEHIVVFDDYHRIENPDIHKLMQVLAENCKQQHCITFISRFDPPLNWNRLKPYDLVNEIRTIDLQFSIEEIQDLSSYFLAKSISKETAAIIYHSTEGWAVPTRLILKTIAENNLNPFTLKSKAGDKHEQTLVFLEDILSQSDKQCQESLMVASLFPRFSTSLLTEIFTMEYPNKKQEAGFLKRRIEMFISQSLFIIPLDNTKQWYRFHDLVRDFLTKRINSAFPKEKINRALRAGSLYFEKVQSFEEAIQLGVKSGDFPLTIAIIERNRLPFLNHQRFEILEHWLNLLPADVTENSPVLLLTRANISEKKGNFEKMMQDLEKASAIMPELNDKDEASCTQWGEYYSIKSSTDFIMGDIARALVSSEKAMHLLHHGNAFSYYFSMAYRVFALNALGRSSEAVDLIMKDQNKYKVKKEQTPVENYFIHTMLLLLEGKLHSYQHLANLTRNIAREKSYKALFVMAGKYLALSNYMQNNLKEALVYANETLHVKFSSRPNWIVLCYQIKTMCHIALHEWEEYEKCVIEMKEFVLNFNTPYYKNILAIIQIEFALLQGNVQKTQLSIKNPDFRINDIVHTYFKPFLTEVKLLLKTNTNQSIEQAEILLNQYEEKARKTYNQVLLLQINCLKIILFIKQNRSKKALELLRKLLTETKDEGLIRLYTDCGYEMKNLFMQLTPAEKNDNYISKILQSFQLAAWHHPQTTQNNIPKNLHPDAFTINDEHVKVTIREKQLLNYLNEGLQNKEIAEKLNITTDSVKKSLYRLYKKLSVNCRRDAVNVARTVLTTPSE